MGVWRHLNSMAQAPSFIFKFRYIDDVLSLNMSGVGDFVDHICSIVLEIKDTTYADRFAS